MNKIGLKKRKYGQFFTEKNPFNHPAFLRWSKKTGLPDVEIVEPFAGSNSIISHLENMSLCNKFMSYDIAPQHQKVSYRDTLVDFPTGYSVCVTNPPWLAKNSATVRGLDYPATNYDDLYKYALEKCLSNCDHVAALVPESFIRANLFKDRLHTFISLVGSIFTDTTHPVGLALFTPQSSKDIIVYSGKKRIGTLSHIEKQRPEQDTNIEIVFNEPKGNLGLIALDNTKEASIRFCNISELEDYKVKKHGRHITKLSAPRSMSSDSKIRDYNAFIGNFREKTGDVLMTCYRGLRKDGMYRRRLDWQLARAVMANV